MDMSFAVQALSIEHLVENHGMMDDRVYSVPYKIDKIIAETKLKSMGVKIDKLTDDQISYLGGWEAGTQ